MTVSIAHASTVSIKKLPHSKTVGEIVAKANRETRMLVCLCVCVCDVCVSATSSLAHFALVFVFVLVSFFISFLGRLWRCQTNAIMDLRGVCAIFIYERFSLSLAV